MPGIAAAGLGWQTRLLDDLGTDQVETLLGVADPRGAEPEHADCLVAVFPQGAPFQQWKLPEAILDVFRPLGWQGQPNVLSPSHVEWRWAEAAEEIVRGSRRARGQGTGVRRDRRRGSGDEESEGSGSRKLARESPGMLQAGVLHPLAPPYHPPVAERGGEMDGRTAIERDVFYRILLAWTLPGLGRLPFAMLPWPPRVHLALFVHRGDGAGARTLSVGAARRRPMTCVRR